MSTLYRPKIISYTLPGGKSRTPDGQRVTRDTPGAIRTESRSKMWYGRYTDATGKRFQVKLSTSKEIARRMLAKLAGDAQLASVGIRGEDEKEKDPFAEHYERPLAEHLDDFARAIQNNNATEKHINQTLTRVRGVLTGCHIGKLEQLAHIDQDDVAEFLASIRRPQEVPELPTDQEWFTLDELTALAGVAACSIPRMV